MPWTKHVRAGRDLMRRAFEAANEIGDLTFAAYSCNNLNTNLLAAGDPLAEVQREAEHGLEFAQKARFGLVIDIIAAQLGLIRTLRGLTPKFGSFDDGQFDELRIRAPFGKQSGLGAGRVLVLDPQAAGALLCRGLRVGPGAASRAQRLLWTSASMFETAEYHFYGALSQAAPAIPRLPTSDGSTSRLWSLITGSSRSGRRIARRISRTAPRWSAPRSRASRAANSMPSASTNRPSAPPAQNGFVHNEALANELAARFYAARGFEKIAHAYLREPGTAICVGAPTARYGNSTSCIRTSGRRARARSDEYDWGTGRTTGSRDRDQSLACRVGRDRLGETDRHAHAHRD